MSMPMSCRDELGRFRPVLAASDGELTLFERIRELEQRCDYWRRRSYDERRRVDLWKARYNRIARKGL